MGFNIIKNKNEKLKPSSLNHYQNPFSISSL